MTWRELQRQNFTKIEVLLDFLEMEEHLREQILKTPQFPLNLPIRLANKIIKNTLNDPILRQFIPLAQEQEATPGFSADPVGDFYFRKQNKLLIKYKGRALLTTTSACAMNCRFCFRQNFDYEKEDKTFDRELVQIASDPSLFEIILSGGDPLSLSNKALADLIKKLSAIPHLKLLRFHSRFPIGIPERIDEELLTILRSTRLQCVFIVHTNHPIELDEEVALSLKKIQCLGIPVLNHTVLLKGVNDAPEIMQELMLKLICFGILPYYLNQLDKVQGAAHYEVPIKDGLALITHLQTSLPGYAVPKYAQEIPGAPSKTLIS